MVEADIERLRQFGSKFQSKPGKNKKNRMNVLLKLVSKTKFFYRKLIPHRKHIHHFFYRSMKSIKHGIVHIKNIILEFQVRMRNVDIKHVFSSIKMRHHKENPVVYRLVEYRKQRGNISIIIRKRIPFQQKTMMNADIISGDTMKEDQMKQPSPFLQISSSIWDFPEK